MNINEQIKIELESLDVSIMPSERREHAEKLAKLERDKFWKDAAIQQISLNRIARSKEIEY